MNESDAPLIRPLHEADLDFAGSLVEFAGWNQLREDWTRLLEVEPDGCFLIDCEGRPAGTATTTTYGNELGWIGMVLVHPDFRRRGLATRLLNHCLEYLLNDKTVACVKLDATPEGMKVYEKLGFQPEFELARWSGDVPDNPKPFAPPPDQGLELELDRSAFGVDRSRYLNRLADDCRDVQVSGHSFGFSRPGRVSHYLGPVVADSPTVAKGLIGNLLSPGPCFWDIPEDNEAAVKLATSLGFQRQRKLIRMWTGSRNTVEMPELQWAISGPETG